MTDETPVDESNEPTETWVTVLLGPEERAPGIDGASTTTYRDPASEHGRRPFLIGGAIVLAVAAIVAVIAVSAGTSGESESRGHRPGHRVAHPVADTSTTWSTTTSTASTTSTTVATATTTTAPAVTTTTAAPPPATPRATADPASPTYVPQPLPPGVHATLTGCSWQPTGGGRYEASGTVTNGPTTNHGWTITVHWLQAGREIGQQQTAIALAPGGSKPWALSLPAPVAPADPFSCALSAA